MDVTEPLLDKTTQLLADSKLTAQQIAVGAEVDINWLAKLKQGRIKEPGVSKIQRVHDFLVARQSSAEAKGL
jgi:transcriptional regulator with XRE-family HTH domain